MKSILIAEDNADLRSIFAKVFESSQFEVRVAVDGEATMRALDEAVPDALVLDINMPKQSGLDVLRYMRSKPEMEHVKVVVVTGNFLAQQQPEAAMADLFLVKPVSISELVSIAQKLVDEP